MSTGSPRTPRENPVLAALRGLSDSYTPVTTIAVVALVGFVLVHSIGTRSPELLGRVLATTGTVVVLGSISVALVVAVVRAVARSVSAPMAHVEAAATGGFAVLGGGRVLRHLRWVEPRFPRRVRRSYVVVVPREKGLTLSLRPYLVIIPWSRVKGVRRREVRSGLLRREAVIIDLARNGRRSRPMTLVVVEEPGLLGLRPASEEALDLLHRRIAHALPPTPLPADAPAWGTRQG